MKKHKTEKPIRPDNFRDLSDEDKMAYRESIQVWKKELEYQLKDFTKTRGYIILARNPTNGKFSGYCENSFSIGWTQTNVKVYRPYYGYTKNGLTQYQITEARESLVTHLQKDVANLQIKYPKYDVFMARIGTKKCPVKIDWNTFYTTKNKSKYDWRNLKFISK